MLHVQYLDFIPGSNCKSFHTQGTRWSRLSIGWSQIYQETKGFAYVLRTKILGRGRTILLGQFWFRLQKIPLNPAWVEDVNVLSWILGQRNSKYSESASKLTFFTKVVFWYKKLKSNKKVQKRITRNDCSKKERASILKLKGFQVVWHPWYSWSSFSAWNLPYHKRNH